MGLGTDTNVSERVTRLEALVEEMLKDNPIEDRIQTQMKELEIEYSADPVERINRVLEALHPYETLDFEE